MNRSWKPIFCAALLLPVFGVVAAGAADNPYRPSVRGTHGMVASGSPMVSAVAMDVLKKGGNAADAGIAALFAAMVVEHTHHSLGGESAILYYSAKDKKVYSINGVGPAPKLATREYFDKLQAPSKTWVILPGGGHSAVFAMPDAFHQALLKNARPLAQR
jgi:gamma-glutamyltranspeptidase/glutathione hydrolase